MRMIILLVLLLVPAGVSAEVTTVTQNDLVVTWYPVQEGITHFAYNISVQNLQDTGRDIDVSTLFSDTSFDISQLKNVKFHEWRNVSSNISVATYENQSYVYSYVDNATGKELTETRWRMVQTGTAAKTVHSTQWKPSKMQSFEKTASVYKERMGIMNVPKYASQETDGTKNGTKWFRLEFDAPLQRLADGWGSVGKVAFEIDGLEYHPRWNESWQHNRDFNVTNNNDSITLEEGYTVNITINHSQWVTDGKSNANGSDVRIVWGNSTSDSHTELDRINLTAFNTETTTIAFKLQANISANATDNNYSVYYGNDGAGTPPNNSSTVMMNSLDYTTYTETDPNSHITVDSFYQITYSSLVRNEEAYVYTPTNGNITDFIAKGSFKVTSSDAYASYVDVFTYADSIGGFDGDVSNGISLAIVDVDTEFYMNFEEATDGSVTSHQVAVGDLNNRYWWTMTRVGSSNTLKVYNDSARTSLLQTFTRTQGTEYNYVYALQTRDSGSSANGQSGVIYELEQSRKYIDPEPTTQVGTEQTLQITLENSTYTPNYGDVNDTFNFTVDVNNPEGGSVNATLFVNNASVDSDTVPANGTASVLWTAPAGGDYTYHWEAASSSSTGRYPESGEAAGPTVYGPSYEKSISIPSGAGRLMCTAAWTGLYNVSGVTVSLTDPGDALYQEFGSNATTRKKITESVIPLPGLANYNITRYDGITRMSIASPAQGAWTFKVRDTNVTSFEIDVDIS